MVLPERTNERGALVSYDLLPPATVWEEMEDGERYYFKFEALGRSFRLNVSENGARFLPRGHMVEFHHSQHGTRTGDVSKDCRHFTGSVREWTAEKEGEEDDGWTAISHCGAGLVGVCGCLQHSRSISLANNAKY